MGAVAGSRVGVAAASWAICSEEDGPGMVEGLVVVRSGQQGTLRHKRTLPPIWTGTWIARVTVVIAPERLFGSRPGKQALASLTSLRLAAQIAHCKRHEVLNGSGRRPASCPAMLPAVTAG